MNKEILNYVTEKTHELINAPSCSAEAKKAAQVWLEAVKAGNAAEATRVYIAELEQDIMPIDMLISFTASEAGKKLFGEERAKAINAHGREIKGKGAKYCDCPACSAAEAILEKKDELFK